MQLKMVDKIRAFIALDLPREAINGIREIQELIKKQNLFIGKFTNLENLHLTFKFLGHIDEATIEKVKKRLREVKLESFEAELGEVGVFSRKFIKIIWIKLENCDKLQKEIDEKLKDLFEPEFRFMSHITIARVKKIKDKKALLEYIKNMKVKKIKFTVDRFFLKKSELFPEGPVYKDVEEYKLGF